MATTSRKRISMIAMAAVFALQLFCVELVAADDMRWDYGVIIDAGSQGSRIYVYRWPHNESGQRVFIQPKTKPQWEKEIAPGISAYADRPSQVQRQIKDLLTFAQDVILREGVDVARLRTFHVYLKATAGMRLLDQQSRDQIMINVRVVLSLSPFFFESKAAAVISGEEEGVYGWLSINYMRNTIFDPQDMVGALDMGGASTQVTFQPVHDIQGNFFNLRIKGENVRLYSHSYLQFGRKVANRRVAAHIVANAKPLDPSVTTMPGQVHFYNPCYAIGYNFSVTEPQEHEPVVLVDPTIVFVGSSNYQQCLSLMLPMLDKDAACWTQACSFAGVYQPRILDKTFVAFGNYATSILKELRLNADASLSEIDDATKVVCNSDMQTLMGNRPDIQKDVLAYYCFNAAWIYNILHNGYGFPRDSRQIHFQEHSVGQLGAMMYEANIYPWAETSIMGRMLSWTEDTRFLVAAGTAIVLGVILAFAITCYLHLWARFTQEVRGGNAYQRVREVKDAGGDA